jgi:hypothetical protein
VTIHRVYSLPPVDRDRLIVGVEHVLRLGPRVLAELLLEATDDVPHLLRCLDEYWRLTPDVALGASDWTAPPRPAIGRFLRDWVHRPAYFAAVARGDVRRDLDGCPAGAPDAQARAFAAMLLRRCGVAP